MKNDPRIEAIVKHPAVSSWNNGERGDTSTGLGCLSQLRRARRDMKRAERNMADEVNAGHRGYDGGGIVAVPRPGNRLLHAALAQGDLPADLRQMIESYLA